MFLANKPKILRNLFKKKLVRIVGAHDGLGAKLIGESGFDGVWASGLEISASYGLPDANILTMSEYLERAIEMNEATTLPVIADCDTGYGNVNNVIHMVEKYEKAGIAAICIEDKLFPKVNSFIEGRQDLADVEEFCGKIRAVKNTQKNPDFMIIARVEALIAGWGMKEALKRANAYAESGADAILIHSKKKDNKEILEFCKNFKKQIPIVVVPTTYPNFNEKEMPKHGIKLVIYANHILRSTIKAVSKTLEILNKTGELASIENHIVPLSKVFELQGMTTLKNNEKNYLKTNMSDTQILIPAAGSPPKNIEKLKKIDKFIAKNYPVSLIKIRDKSILEMNIDTAKMNNIDKFKIIVGYKSELFNNYKKIKNLKVIKNLNYSKTSQIDSIIMGLDPNLNSIIIFSDIIYEKEILQRLISRDDDISLVIDVINQNSSDFCDMTITQKKPIRDGRILTQHRANIIEKIQKGLDLKKSNYEFVGISYFSKKGTKTLINEYQKLKKTSKNLDFNTLINHLIKKNIKVNAIEINGGWMEIRSKKQFEQAEEIFN
jgi:phosphoenolpyruvate phosphomutase